MGESVWGDADGNDGGPLLGGPYFARDDERARLDQAFDEAERTGEPVDVTLIGIDGNPQVWTIKAGGGDVTSGAA